MMNRIESATLWCENVWRSLRYKLVPSGALPSGRKQWTLFIIGWSLAVAALSYTGYEVPRRIAFSKTPSLSHRFFYFKHHFTDDELKTGAYVIFQMHTRIVEDCWPCRVVKRIGCDEGDHLASYDGGYFYCQKRFLGQAKTHSKKGKPVEYYAYNGLIPDGKYFAIGECPDSFDSRYIGFLEKKNVEAIAIPIF